MSSSRDIRRTIRRFGSAKTPLRRREKAELLFVEQLRSIPKLLLDTTVYVDELQDRLPKYVDRAMRSTTLWHSTVTECELSALAGLLDPVHPDSAKAVERLLFSINRRPIHRVVNPDREVWREAGILAGSLARVQRYGKAERRRALNDALIFCSAAKAGLSVLTRNVADFDLLMQMKPQGKAVFYEV